MANSNPVQYAISEHQLQNWHGALQRLATPKASYHSTTEEMLREMIEWMSEGADGLARQVLEVLEGAGADFQQAPAGAEGEG